MAPPRTIKTHLLGWLCVVQGSAALAGGLLYIATLPFAAIPHFLGQWEACFALVARLLTTLTAAIFIITGLALLKCKTWAHRWLPGAAGLMFLLAAGRILLFGPDSLGQLLGYLAIPLLILYLLASQATEPGLHPKPLLKNAAAIWLLLAALMAAILAFRSLGVLRHHHPQLLTRNLPPAATPPGFSRSTFPPTFSVALPPTFKQLAPPASTSTFNEQIFQDATGARVVLKSRAMVEMLPAAYLHILGFRNYDEYLRHFHTDHFGLLSGGTARDTEEITIGPLHGFLTIFPVPAGEVGEVWLLEVLSGDKPTGAIELRGFKNGEEPQRIINSLVERQG